MDRLLDLAQTADPAQLLLPVESLFLRLPSYHLNEAAGRPLPAKRHSDRYSAPGTLPCLAPLEFLMLGRCCQNGRWSQ